MKAFYTILLVLLVGTAYGQSNLPACQGSDTTKWDNCSGEETIRGSHQYKGEFLNGQRHGFGVMDVLHPQFVGDKFVGEFKNGSQNGHGTYTKANGDKYVGELKGSKRHGKGTYTHVDGNEYVGEFKDHNKHGQGTFTFKNGSWYVGEYVEDKLNGRGILYNANGSIKESGIYKDGNLVTSQYIDPNSFTRVALGGAIKDTSDNPKSDKSTSFDVAKLKCGELGFKPETEGFGKCVLQLTK